MKEEVLLTLSFVKEIIMLNSQKLFRDGRKGFNLIIHIFLSRFHPGFYTLFLVAICAMLETCKKFC